MQGQQEPAWKEWNVPTLRQTCIQANANVVALEASQDSTFDYWLKISTLEFRKQLLVPVKLAAYHREALKGKTINTSVTLNKRGDGWWLTLSYDKVVLVHTAPSAPVVGVDVGIANFVTTSDRPALRHLSQQTARAAEARPAEAAAQGEVAQVPGKERRQEASLHEQQERAAARPACAARDQPGGQPVLYPARGRQIAYEHLSVADDEVQGACHERLLVRLQPGPHPQADRLECRQTRRSRNQSQECVYLAGVQRVPLPGQSQPTQSANVLLRGLRLQHTC